MTVNEMRQTRAKHIHDARAIVEKSKSEQREMLAEEQAQFDTLMGEAAKLKAQYEKIEGDEAQKRSRLEALDEAERDLNTRQGRRTTPGRPSSDSPESKPFTIEMTRRQQGMRAGQWMERKERVSYQHGSPGWRRNQAEYQNDFRAWLAHGQITAALQTDSDTAGGYLTVPEQLVAEMIKDVDDMVWIRSLARTFTTNAQSLGAIKRTSKFSAFNWGSELSNAEDNADTSLKFGKRSLTPHYMTGSILVSRDLLRAAIMDPDMIVREEMTRDSGELEERAFMTGSGAQQPLGVFTASNDGISTARDVSTGNTTTTIGADNLRECKYTLKTQYRADPTLRWVWHRDSIKQISKLKDGNGQYLWQPGITQGDPDRLLNIVFAESEFAPNTYTTGQYVGILGAWRYYWIADSLQMDMQRLIETYAKYNQVQIIARRKVDGMPQVEEAFVRSKLG